MDKFKIGIDFEGMKDDLSKYDDIIIEAKDENEAEVELLQMLEDDGINLPFFSVTNEDEDG